MNARILLITAGFVLAWLGLVSRAGYLQLVTDERMDRLRDRQFQTVISLQPRRGSVADRKGRELAMSMSSHSLYADPSLVPAAKHAAKKLAPILKIPRSSIEAKLKDKNRRFIWLARQLSEEKAIEIRALGLKGISFVEEYSRFYPKEQLLAPLIGMVGSEGQGLEGLELQLDSILEGNKKKISVRRDARGRPLLADGRVFAEAPGGGEVRLTIDSNIQHFVEQELANTARDFDADQAFGVVLDVNTSAVLALAMTAGFDANKASKYSTEQRRPRMVTDTFEPGSVIKTFTIAAAIRDKKVAPNTRYNIEGGRIRVGEHFIRESDQNHKWNSLTVSEILAFSSNVGTAKIAFDLGDEALRKALEDFGFGQKTGLEFPGEARGLLQPLPWRQHLLANVSFGHGMSTSLLQVANGYAAIANGGVLKTPYMISSLRNLETGEITEYRPKEVRRVLTPEDAAAMRMILAGVTAAGGTGFSAKVDGFTVAGKTGTAQKPNPQGKGYLPGAYVSSFAGFFPVHDPKYVIYVVVDSPKKNAFYGSQVAAPLFSRIAGSIARAEGLAPVMVAEKSFVRSPRGPTQEAAAQPVDQVLKSALEQGVIPPLEGLTVREVLRLMNGQNMELKIKGEGRVSQSYPSAGEKIFRNRQLTVILK